MSKNPQRIDMPKHDNQPVNHVGNKTYVQQENQICSRLQKSSKNKKKVRL